jgi:phage shock protein A
VDFLDRVMRALAGEDTPREEDPQKAIGRLVRELKRKLTEGRARISGSVRDGNRIQKDIIKLRVETQRHLKSARVLLQHGDEQGARQALKRKVRAEQLQAEMERELVRQREAIRLLKGSLKDLAERVHTIEVRRQKLRTRARRAKALAARQQVMESGRLRGAESLLEDLDARLEVEEELLSAGSVGDSLERRFAELEQSEEFQVELLEDLRKHSED